MWGEPDKSPFEPEPNPLNSGSQQQRAEGDSWGSQASSSNDVKISVSSGSLADKEKEVARREKEIEAREKALKKNVKSLDGSGKLKNWPFPCFPANWNCIHHDIADDALPQHVSLVRGWYLLWMWNCASLIWNLVAVANYYKLATDANHDVSVAGPLIAGIVWLPCFPVLMFMFVYRGAYAFGINPDKVNFVWLSIKILIHIGYVGLMAAGMISGGGLFYAIDASTKNLPSSGAVFCAVCFAFWTINLIATVVLFFKTRSAWKSFDPKNVSVMAAAKSQANDKAREVAVDQAKKEASSQWGGGGGSSEPKKDDSGGWGSGGGW